MKHRVIHVLLTIVLALTLAFMVACSSSKSTKNEKEMIHDLGSHTFEQIYEPNLSITDLEIIKRQTVQEDRTDTVYVTLTIDDENAKYVRSYILHYNLYDEGWILDGVEGYMDGENTTYPLTGPDESCIDDQFYTFNAMHEYDTHTDNYWSWEVVDSEVDLEAKEARFYVEASREYPFVTMYETFVFDYIFYDSWEAVTDVNAARTEIKLEWNLYSHYNSIDNITGKGYYYISGTEDEVDLYFDECDNETGSIALDCSYKGRFAQHTLDFGGIYFLPIYLDDFSGEEFSEALGNYVLAYIDLGEGRALRFTPYKITFLQDDLYRTNGTVVVDY